MSKKKQLRLQRQKTVRNKPVKIKTKCHNDEDKLNSK